MTPEAIKQKARIIKQAFNDDEGISLLVHASRCVDELESSALRLAKIEAAGDEEVEMEHLLACKKECEESIGWMMPLDEMERIGRQHIQKNVALLQVIAELRAKLGECAALLKGYRKSFRGVTVEQADAMDRREEVSLIQIEERAKQYAKELSQNAELNQYESDMVRAVYRDAFKDGIDSTKPVSYVPREEVTEGWWFASEIGTGRDREPIEVYVHEIKDSGTGHTEKSLRCGVHGIHPEWESPPITLFTDFLPVPAWLVEGI